MSKEKRDPCTDKAAGKIASAGIHIQTTFSIGMNKLFLKMPGKKIKILLVVFCLAGGGFSIYLAANAIVGDNKNQPSFNVKQMDVPKHYNRTGSEVNEPENYVTEEMYQEIQSYKKYMDSIQQPIRYGLLDSIRVMEEIYYSQQIK